MRVSRAFPVLPFLLSANISVQAQASGDASNPLTGSVGIHDPSAVIMEKGVYYIYQTGGGFKTSRDRLHWTNGGRVFAANPAWWDREILPPEKPALWAGDISYWNGTFYYYYSVSAWMDFHSCIGLATNTTLNPDDPAYKWVDRGKVIDSAKGNEGRSGNVNVIDPCLFQDGDGRKFLNYGSFTVGMRQIEIDPATGLRPVNAAKPILISDHLGEASFLIKVGKWYYYTCSRGTCCAAMQSSYQVVYGRSQKPTGPFLTRNGGSMEKSAYEVLLSGDAAHPGQGGQSFFRDHDSLFMAYHAYTAPDGRSLLNIRPVYLDKDEWLTMDPAKGEIIRGGGTAAIRIGGTARTGRSRAAGPFGNAEAATLLFGKGFDATGASKP